jgi:hypothetical protein
VHLRALLQVFPDAVLVQMHRPPAEFTASLCSLAYHCQYCSVRNCDAHTLGHPVVRTMAGWATINAGDREQLPAGSVLDIDYHELVSKPEEIVRCIHARAGVTAQIGNRLEEWLSANHRSRKQSHRYSLEQFGLDTAFVEKEFGAAARPVSAGIQ